MYVELVLSIITILLLVSAVWLGCDFQHQWMTHDDGYYHLLPTGKSLRPIMPTTFLDWEGLWRMSMDTRQPRRTYLLTETDKKLVKRAEEPVMWDVGLEENIADRKERAVDAKRAKTRMEKVKSTIVPVGARSGMSQAKSAPIACSESNPVEEEASARTPNKNIPKKKPRKKPASKRNTAAKKDDVWRMFTDDKQEKAVGNCGTMTTTRTNEEGRVRKKMITMTARTEDVEERWRMKTTGN